MDQLGRAGEAMGEAEGNLGEGNADSAVDSQGRALDALAQGRAGSRAIHAAADGTGSRSRPHGRLGQPRAQQDTDPLGRPLRGRDYGDDFTVKVPGEIDVQRARRIIEELRRRFGDFAAPAGRARLHRAAAEGLLSPFGPANLFPNGQSIAFQVLLCAVERKARSLAKSERTSTFDKPITNGLFNNR